ncbi:hypothetical protein SARC_00754 [Sphaeroforma arctica JP610]|uniref:Uncharacterized protein n=1 Tax=Sphaeroforma arctica JP610 TaxID=667725 RepID=A0A0L0GE30_9EUKA|nr:hypothetical protein SARC_00754 [Sphaeroforma arctica JP610]KNC87131.1 hypothetical protein SARC_00754 [Sphaeroforma arctica JP610]|eukprot:XP_014161033.1 hypothetical protein SARC_00754 [Sphaeroforma arctica JP610]
MSAQELMRQMMDDLMGQNRNGDKTSPDLVFTDHEVCKPFLLGVCTRELFINTKKEEPLCGKEHDDKLKLAYEEAVKKGKTFPFEEDVLQFLDYKVRDMDRELGRAHDRLSLQQAPIEDVETHNKIMDIAKQIGEKLAKAEEMGEEGKVDDAQALMAEVESLKRDKLAAERSVANDGPAQQQYQQQKLRVCDVCSALLSQFDSDRRLADHFGGKVHAGCLRLRTLQKEWKEKILERRNRPVSRDAEDRDRSDRRDRDRDEKTSRSSRSDRDRSDKDRSDRDRGSDRRDRDRDRSYRERSDRDRSDRDRSDRDMKTAAAEVDQESAVADEGQLFSGLYVTLYDKS